MADEKKPKDLAEALSEINEGKDEVEFEGTFRDHIQGLQRQLERQYREEAGDRPDDEEIAERASAEAQYIVARDWLVERWGERFPCPVCGNIEWILSPVEPAYNGFLSFHINCRYCGNSMSIIPGHADLDEPQVPDEQLQLPDQ